MISRFKSQNILVIIAEVLIILGVIASITYAIYNISSNILLRTNKLSIDTDIYGDTYIDSDNIKLIPIKDTEVLDNDSNVLKINFNVRGSKDNIINNIIYDIALTNLNIDCELINKYFKWQLYKNGNLLERGDFSNEFDTIIENRLVLTSIQQDLVNYNNEPDNYQFILWLSESCQDDNNSNCLDSQNSLLNKNISGKLEIELYSGSKKELIRNPRGSSTCVNNLDKSGANKPVISDGMIPVYYDSDNSIWKKADIYNNSQDYKWYDYQNQVWANIVLVNNYNKYKDNKIGSTIENKDIIAFYVWIPRYKYQVWNIDGNNNLASKYKEGINIEFENGLEDSGNITCSDIKCIGNNQEWVTHPIFTSKNIKGFWIAKYIISGNDNKPLIINNNNFLNNYNREKALSTSLKFLDYGITSFNVELVTNLEWGAISYLLISKYGNILNNEPNNYLISGINDDNYEMVINDYNILGNATFEIGKSIDNKTEILYRNKLFNYDYNINNYGFRNVLLQDKTN